MRKRLFIAAATALLVSIASVMLYGVYWLGCIDLAAGFTLGFVVLSVAFAYGLFIRFIINSAV